MRVFELAREVGVSSADVIKAARNADVEATSAISSLDSGDADKLRSVLAGLDREALAARRAEKSRTAAELNAAFTGVIVFKVIHCLLYG